MLSSSASSQAQEAPLPPWMSPSPKGSRQVLSAPLRSLWKKRLLGQWSRHLSSGRWRTRASSLSENNQQALVWRWKGGLAKRAELGSQILARCIKTTRIRSLHPAHGAQSLLLPKREWQWEFSSLRPPCFLSLPHNYQCFAQMLALASS